MTRHGADQSVHMEKGPIGKTLFAFALPVLLSQILQQLYSMTDCAVIGHFGGGFSLAAVGVADLIISVLVNFFIGFSSGVSVITARLFGAYAYDDLKKVISSVTRLALFLGVITMVLGLIGADAALRLLRSPAEVRSLAVVYLRICFCGIPAQMVYNVGTAILRSLGDTRTPTRLFFGSVICNLGLDFVLVVVFSFGVQGAAAATLVSQWFLAVTILHRAWRLDPAYSLRFFGPRLRLRELGGILRNGLPAGMQAVFMSVSSLLIQVTINSFGPDAIAGMTVYAKIEGFLYFPAFAYGIALTGFVGQNLGAGRTDRIESAVRLSVRTVSCVILPLSAGLMIACPLVLRLFTDSAGILAYAEDAVFFTFPVYVFYAVNQVYLGAVKGLGNTSYPMFCTLVSYCFFRVLWCRLLIPLFPTMRVVYLCYDVSFLLLLLLLLPMYRCTLRRIRRGDTLPLAAEKSFSGV
ncbi:MAG: MATE family efflux transporter [Bacillota bacterium]|jgi:putative MATE family efflux protein